MEITLFNSIADKVEEFSKREGTTINIFILSKDNKFISGLGGFGQG